jgi:hypothetical protein
MAMPPTIVLTDSSKAQILLPPGISVQSADECPPSPLYSPAVSVASVSGLDVAAGCQHPRVYRRLMHPWNVWIRERLIESLEKQMPVLEAIQVLIFS